VVNKGATIESGGQMVVGAAVLKNENADWSTWTEETLIQKNKKIYFAQPGSTIYEEHEVHFTNADEASNAIVLLSDGSKMAGGDGEDWYYAIFDQYHLTDHVKTSDPARMVSGQDMLIYGDQLTTGHSQMAAGKNFSIKGDTVKNVSTPGYQLEHTKNENQLGESRDGLYYHYVEYVGTLKNRKGNKHNYLGNYLPPNNLINTYELPILNATINTTPSSAKIDELSTGNDTSVIVDVKDNTITLPNSALYIINADDPNLPLIQTDPAFTDYKQWL
ncbi:hypothetical protein, partial [Moraxella porci]|uniref:hypothetical protein n=1 Tax=Moraxella porci TaxID=1288392 RepID=UPI0024474E86